jgi:hypothetical protein
MQIAGVPTVDIVEFFATRDAELFAVGSYPA